MAPAGPGLDVGGVAAGAVTGYVASPATSRRHLQRIYVSAPGSRSVRIRVFRIGWYGGAGGREVLVSRHAARRPPAAVRAQLPHRTDRVRLASDAQLQDPLGAPDGRVHRQACRPRSGQRDCLFVVRSSTAPATARATPDLHLRGIQRVGRRQPVPGRRGSGRDHPHHAGRRGLLRPTVRQRHRRWPVLRPRRGDGLVPRALPTTRFRTRPASRSTSDPAQLAATGRCSTSAIPSTGLSARLPAFARARDHRGTSLLFLSSDTMAWKVRLRARDAGGQPGRPPRADDRRLQGVRGRETRTAPSPPAGSPTAARR